MIYKLVKSANFIKSAKKLAKQNSDFLIELNIVLNLLSSDVFNPKLKTHKLKGDLSGFWACSFNFDLRIVFKFVKALDENTDLEVDALLLSYIGSHDEVY